MTIPYQTKLRGNFVFNAPQQTVWDLLMDVDKVAQAMPWVEALIPVEGQPLTWRATAQISFYSENDTYTGTIQMTDIQGPDHYRMYIKEDSSEDGVSGSVIIQLKFDDEKQKTIVLWQGEANLPAKMAELKPHMIQLGANMMSMIFFSRLAKFLPPETPL